MSSIINNGDTYRGISVFGRGVFANDKYVRTYAGQHKDGYACGLAVLTYCDGTKDYAEHGPDGKYDGRYLGRCANGTTYYDLHERGGKLKEYARVSADGRCSYNGTACAPDDPRLLALIAQVAPVEVRPQPQTPPAIGPPLTSNRPMDQPARFAPAGAREDHGHRGASPRRTPSPVAVRHNPTAAALYRLIVSPRSLLAGLCSFRLIPFGFGRPRKPWPTCHCALRCAHCGHRAWRGTLGLLKRQLRAAHGVLMACSRGIPPPGSHGTMRSEECAAFGRARLTESSRLLTEYSWRTLGAYRHLFHTGQHAARNALPSAERAFHRSPAASSARARTT
jgi:hypothetical protein